jgi:hypothetical protein
MGVAALSAATPASPYFASDEKILGPCVIFLSQFSVESQDPLAEALMLKTPPYEVS